MADAGPKSPPSHTPRRDILLIDDHRVFTDLLAFALDAEPDLCCVAVANSAQEGLAKAAAYAFDAAIVDLELPDGGGLGVIAKLRVLRPSAKLIVLTGHARPGLAELADRAGADAFLPKDDPLRAVLAVVRDTAPAPTSPGAPPPSGPRLTAREHDVLTQLAAGADARQIAQGLGLSVHTVRDHLKAIRKKFGVHSQLDVVIEAGRLGMVGLGERFR